MDKVGIFGAAGMASEAGDVAWALGLEPFYIVYDEVERFKYLHLGNVILESEIYQYEHLPFVIGIGDNSIRKTIAERFFGRLEFMNLIHPSATFGRNQRESLEKCKGTVVAAGTRLTNNIKIGNFVIFNQNSTLAHNCTVEDFVHVAPGANVSGNVHLETGCWLGAGSVVNQGSDVRKLKIGNNTMIGSGAVVVSDCESNAVYAGIPAKRIK
ncbi:sugar O-acyltransferase (sialic acid O-acetyltransferase NeuD family) [Marinobacter sp. LV10R520-4]|uniref:acetyltransferase n=1 Tax=Marinobacter sp. LV10R520-4 TaxID=1761796 RepID=UPI000BF360D0|nr:acetyltransferase [Marinobacter sp. LV10R520-4]PFG53729.1 sugar O-acyltransferase (sialic acid O-acetyltransferase NeuD family) [Marinobacter sp. LV10R520-4]